MLKPAKEIVICTPTENKTKSGIALSTEEGKDGPDIGTVHAIGVGKLPIEINIGDEIVYRRYTESKTEVNGKEYNFIEFKDIVAVVL